MIDVKDAEPRIMITCGIYKERDVCEDVLNTLFSYGIHVGCKDFYGRGFSIVYLAKDVDVYGVVRTLTSRYIRGYWVIPIDVVCRASYEDIARCVVEAILLKGIRLPIRMVGICRRRGVYIESCSRLLRYVGELIESLGIAEVDFRGYEYVVRIEIVYEKALISIYRRDEERIFRVGRGLSH